MGCFSSKQQKPEKQACTPAVAELSQPPQGACGAKPPATVCEQRTAPPPGEAANPGGPAAPEDAANPGDTATPGDAANPGDTATPGDTAPALAAAPSGEGDGVAPPDGSAAASSLVKQPSKPISVEVTKPPPRKEPPPTPLRPNATLPTTSPPAVEGGSVAEATPPESS